MLILIENWLIRLSDRPYFSLCSYISLLFSWKCPTIIAVSLLNVIYAIEIQKFFSVASLTQILEHINYIFKHYFDQCGVRRNIGILSLF